MQEQPHRITALPNGLRVLTLEMPAMDSVSLGLWIGAGGRHEEERRQSSAHATGTPSTR